MSSATVVLVCALDLLGRSDDRLPLIEILHTRPAGVSANALVFVDSRAGVIYLIASSSVFRDAMSAQSSNDCRDPDSLEMVASIIAHELWHLTHGPDQEGADYAQLMELRRLGVGPGRWPYSSVQQSMEAVMKSPRERSRRVPGS